MVMKLLELPEEEINRINKFWDKKTVFVHRRALLLGLILGFILGISTTTYILALVVSKYGWLLLTAV